MRAELTDEDYGRRLGDRLHAAVADVGPQANLAATVRRRYTRRTLLIRATTGVAAAAAAAAAGGTIQAIRPAGSDQTADVVYVRAQALNALENGKNYVVHATTILNDRRRQEAWVDRVSGARRIDVWEGNNAPSVAISSRSGRDGSSSLFVYYGDRTWSELRGKAGRPIVFRGWEDTLDPESIHAALRNGRMRLLGKEHLDGHEVLHLQNEDSRFGHNIVREYWVDAQSFLVRRTSGGTGNRPSVVTTYEWLPRTGENLAHLKLTPPAGFTKRK